MLDAIERLLLVHVLSACSSSSQAVLPKSSVKIFVLGGLIMNVAFSSQSDSMLLDSTCMRQCHEDCLQIAKGIFALWIQPRYH